MYKPLPVTSSVPPQRRPENPSGATAVIVDRVHHGPHRDQLVDLCGIAFLNRPMQQRLASGAGDATDGRAAAAVAAIEKQNNTKRIVMGCFSGWLGKSLWIGWEVLGPVCL